MQGRGHAVREANLPQHVSIEPSLARPLPRPPPECCCAARGGKRDAYMDERDLRGLIGRVKDGRLSRRAFVQRMVAVGLTAPMAGLMLAGNGIAMAAD